MRARKAGGASTSAAARCASATASSCSASMSASSVEDATRASSSACRSGASEPSASAASSAGSCPPFSSSPRRLIDTTPTVTPRTPSQPGGPRSGPGYSHRNTHWVAGVSNGNDFISSEGGCAMNPLIARTRRQQDDTAARAADHERNVLVVAFDAVLPGDMSGTNALVVAPALNSRLRRWLSDEDGARRRAAERAAAVANRLEQIGVRAEGRVGDADPLLAIADALSTFPADEIVIAAESTRPSRIADELGSRARARFALPTYRFRSEEHTSELQSLRHLVCR